MDVFDSTLTSILPDDGVPTVQDDRQQGTEDYSETYADKLGDGEWEESSAGSSKVSKYNLSW